MPPKKKEAGMGGKESTPVAPEVSAGMMGLADAEDRKQAAEMIKTKKKDEFLMAKVAKAQEIKASNPDNRAVKYFLKLHQVGVWPNPASFFRPCYDSCGLFMYSAFRVEIRELPHPRIIHLLFFSLLFSLFACASLQNNKLETLEVGILKRLLHCVNTGLENPDSGLGCYAMSPVSGLSARA